MYICLRLYAVMISRGLAGARASPFLTAFFYLASPFLKFCSKLIPRIKAFFSDIGIVLYVEIAVDQNFLLYYIFLHSNMQFIFTNATFAGTHR